MDKLNVRQTVFVAEYAKDGNGKRAAIAARYSERTAEAQASRLLRNVKVRAALATLQDAAAEKAEISVQWVLDELLAALEKAKGDDYDAATVVRVLRTIGEHLRMFPKGAEVSVSQTSTHMTITVVEK